MKKTLLFIAALFVAAQLFAVMDVLPEGTSVNAYDVIRDGDDIVEARLSQSAVINTPLGPLECIGTVYFYKSGKLRACFLKNPTKVSTDIGDMLFFGDSYEPECPVEFYESGSLKQATLIYSYYNAATKKIVKFPNKVKTAFGEIVLTASVVTFYDSGSTEKALLRTFYLAGTGADITYTCPAGTFKIDTSVYENPYPYEVKNPNFFVQYPSGKLKRLYVAGKSFEINSPLGKGIGKSVVEVGWGQTERRKVELREDGSVLGYVTDELIMTEVAGLKVNIPSGTYITFYSNGNICDFAASNSLTVAIAGRQVECNENSKFRASKDGKKIISAPINTIKRSDGAEYTIGSHTSIEFMHNNGIPGLLNTYSGGYRWFDSGLRYELVPGDSYRDNTYYFVCFPLKTNKEKKIYRINTRPDAKDYYLQKYDNVDNVGMVYFAADGTPSGYSMYKFDDFGEILIDEDNQPVVDTQNKKKFSKIE